ncbi:MAG TPA: SDR family NAD(P)-dependent oxidoreductase [Candidatus Tectomicrobia bacterium]
MPVHQSLGGCTSSACRRHPWKRQKKSATLAVIARRLVRTPWLAARLACMEGEGAMRFRNNIALISGAGSGIGRATAQIIGAEGGTVVGVDVNREALEQIMSGIRQAGGQARGLVADALHAGQVQQAVQQTLDEFGRVDILVNAVGGSTIIPKSDATVDELTLDDWQRLLTFNLNGTFLFCHAVVPIMKRQRHGKIVNISSVAGRGLSERSSSAYSAAKGGIIAFTRKLSFELGPFGITCNAIAPSMTLSERIHAHWEHMSDTEQEAMIARTPLRRMAQPEDQARVICFLASADADFVTGVTIDVTGGQ